MPSRGQYASILCVAVIVKSRLIAYKLSAICQAKGLKYIIPPALQTPELVQAPELMHSLGPQSFHRGACSQAISVMRYTPSSPPSHRQPQPSALKQTPKSQTPELTQTPALQTPELVHSLGPQSFHRGACSQAISVMRYTPSSPPSHRQPQPSALKQTPKSQTPELTQTPALQTPELTQTPALQTPELVHSLGPQSFHRGACSLAIPVLCFVPAGALSCC